MRVSRLLIKARRHTVVFSTTLWSVLTVSVCAYATSDITSVGIVDEAKKKDFRAGQLVQDRAEQYYKDREALLRRQNQKLVKEQRKILGRLESLESDLAKEKVEKESKEKEERKKK